MVAWPDMWLGKAAYFGCKAMMLVLPVVWLVLVDRSRLSLSPARRGGFVTGIAFGALISGVILLVYLTIGQTWIDGTMLRDAAIRNGIGTIGPYFVIAMYSTLINAALEEYVFRWFMFTRWEKVVSPRLAVLAAAVCFTIHHVIALRMQLPWNATILASTGVFLGGLIWSGFYYRYRSIWPGYVSHALVDLTIFAIGWWVIFGSR